MTMKINTIPPKRLAETIDGSAMTFKVNDILGFDGVDLSSSIVGDTLYASFQDTSGTILELFKIDPTTIASTSITILKRGLQFNEDGTETEVSGNKRLWVKNQTIINFGTDNPALLAKFVRIVDDQTNAGVKTFSSIPVLPASDPSTSNQAARKSYVDTQVATKVGLTGDETVAGVKTFSSSPVIPAPATDLQAATKKYVDDTAFAGAPDASTTTKGVVERATAAEFLAGTETGGTGAVLFIDPKTFKDNFDASSLKAAFTSGEALTAGQAVFVANGDDNSTLSSPQQTAFGSSVQNGTSTSNWFAQSFQLASTTTIKGVELYMDASSQNIKVSIRSSLTGSDLASVTTGPSAGAGWKYFLLDSSVSLTGTTTYYIVFRATTSASAVTMYGSGTSVYPDGQGYSSTNSGGSWSSSATVVDFAFKLSGIITTSGRVYKASGYSGGSNDQQYSRAFIGFANSSVSSGQSVMITINGVVTGLSGLTTGTHYYLSDTFGALSSSSGTVSKKVGIALSSTTLLIKNENA